MFLQDRSPGRSWSHRTAHSGGQPKWSRCQTQRPKVPCRPSRHWICPRLRAFRHIPFADQRRSHHIWRTDPPRLFPHAPTGPRQLEGESTESAGAYLRLRRLASLRFPSPPSILLQRIESFKFDLTCTYRARSLARPPGVGRFVVRWMSAGVAAEPRSLVSPHAGLCSLGLGGGC